MHWHALFFIFVFRSLWGADFVPPKNISSSDLPIISRSFASGFITRTPVILIGQDEFKTQFGIRSSSIDTKQFAKLGDRSEVKEFSFNEFSFSKQLPFNVELGAQSSLSFFDRDINTFGGFFRWGFIKNDWAVVSFVSHGSSVNFKNLISTNLYGGDLNFDFKLWSAVLSLGTGVLRTTSTFDPSLFTGFSGKEATRTYGKLYSHQSMKLAYIWNAYSFSAQGDWLKEFFSSASISYLF